MIESIILSLGDYLWRVLPGFVLFAALLYLMPIRYWRFRLAVHIVLFLLIRDAMTPAGLWSIGVEGGFWLRFDAGPLALVFLSIGSLAVALGMNRIEAPLRERVVYWRGSRALAIALGLGGAALVYLPFLFLYAGLPPEARGGEVAVERLPFILLLALCGNFYEELIFRGYLQGWAESDLTPLRSILISGLTFACGHVFLAYTVTDVGLPVLVFTLYEGLICAVVRWRAGVLPATLTHGLAIFLLAAGFSHPF